MIYNIGYVDGTKLVTASPGDEIKHSIAECFDVCEKENCELILEFNGIQRRINKGSYIKGLIDNWFDNSYVPLQDSRDKKLNDLGI